MMYPEDLQALSPTTPAETIAQLGRRYRSNRRQMKALTAVTILLLILFVVISIHVFKTNPTVLAGLLLTAGLLGICWLANEAFIAFDRFVSVSGALSWYTYTEMHAIQDAWYQLDRNDPQALEAWQQRKRAYLDARQGSGIF